MRISLRLKLSLLSLLLFLIPLIGLRFSTTLQASLLAARQEALMFTAKGVATALAGRPDIFDRELFHSLDQGRDLYLFHLTNSIRLNGNSEDWLPELEQADEFGAEEVLYSETPYNYDSFHFKHIVGQSEQYLYALFIVHDNNVIFRDKNSLRLDLADHIQIGIVDPDGLPRRYLMATERPGWLNAFLMDPDPEKIIPLKNEPRIQGVWTINDDGYTVEMRIPLSLIGEKLAFAVADMDDPDNRKIVTLIGTANPEKSDEMGWLLAPSKAIEDILKSLDRPHSRIRVVDKNKRVRARFGSLKAETTADEETSLFSSLLSLIQKGLRPVTKLFTEPFSMDFTDPASQPSTLDIQGLEEGLQGRSSITSYRIAAGKVEIMAAITPLIENDSVVGAVLVEQTTNSILALKNRVIEESIGLTILAFIVVASGLLLFASRISSRIRRLRNQAAQAIDASGKICANVEPLEARDEIGDLSRALSSMLSQLEEQNRYREKMADNLEHEMRTPLAGISASLNNLRRELDKSSQPAEKYVAWALHDLARLESLLTTIRDATSLKKALECNCPETFDLTAALPIWLELGYQKSYPEISFSCTTPDDETPIYGDPDQLRQMLDKLIDNAASFHTPESTN